MTCALLLRLLRSGLTYSASRAVCTSVLATRSLATSSDIISKWQGLLSYGIPQQSTAESSSRALQRRDDMQQLMHDALQIYKSEGAAAVLPDRITDVFMTAYSQLETQEQQLTFFTLLAQEFGVQGRSHT